MHINLLKKFFALRGFPHSNLVARKVNFTAKPISISLIKPITPYYSGSRSYVTTALAQETVQDKSNASEEIDYSDLKTRKSTNKRINLSL